MDILVMNPLITARRLQILRGMAVITPVGGRLADEVEEYLVVRVEPALVVTGDDFVKVTLL